MDSPHGPAPFRRASLYLLCRAVPAAQGRELSHPRVPTAGRGSFQPQPNVRIAKEHPRATGNLAPQAVLSSPPRPGLSHHRTPRRPRASAPRKPVRRRGADFAPPGKTVRRKDWPLLATCIPWGSCAPGGNRSTSSQWTPCQSALSALSTNSETWAARSLLAGETISTMAMMRWPLTWRIVKVRRVPRAVGEGDSLRRTGGGVSATATPPSETCRLEKLRVEQA